jgi:hypothetical protein
MAEQLKPVWTHPTPGVAKGQYVVLVAIVRDYHDDADLLVPPENPAFGQLAAEQVGRELQHHAFNEGMAGVFQVVGVTEVA